MTRKDAWYRKAFLYLMKKADFEVCFDILSNEQAAYINCGKSRLGHHFLRDVVQAGWHLKNEPNNRAFAIKLERAMKNLPDYFDLMWKKRHKNDL